MNLLEKKLWEILEVARSGDLNEIATKYLKEGLGNFYAKYVYDRDLSFLQFTKWIESDLKSKRVRDIDICESLYKIYHLHRDLDTAIEFKNMKIKLMKESGLKGLEFERFSLANLYFDKGLTEKALKTLQKVIKNIDTHNMQINVLELYIKSLIMQNQLKQDLKYKKDEVLEDIKYLETIFVNTAKYFDEKKQAVFKVQILYLYLSYWLVYQNYAKAIVYGEKAVDILESNDVPIKISLRYRIYESLGYAYLLNKKYDKASQMAKRAVSLKNKLISIDTFSAVVILAESSLAQGEYDEALNYAHEANGYVNNSIDKLEYIYELLAKIYKAKKDDERAKEYLEKLCRLQEVSKS